MPSEYAGKKSPELQSSWISRALLGWFDREVWRHSKKEIITMEDVFELDDEYTSTEVTRVWEKHWDPLMAEYKSKKKSAQEHEFVQPPSIIWCVACIFKWEFLWGSIIKLIGDTLQLAQPYLLSRLITFVADSNAPFWEGLMYAVLIFLVSELRSLLQNNYIIMANTKIGVRMLSMLSSAVYKKALHLSPAARRQKSVGEIINLMSNDLNKFFLTLPFLHYFWSFPYQIVLLLIYLYWTIGYSALSGVLVMIVFIPINVYFAKFLKKWQTELSTLKDKRTSLVNEMLNGMKVIKLYTWERPMEERINEIREEELKVATKLNTVKEISEAFNHASPFLVAFLTFATFLLSSSDHELTPQIAFVSLSLFTQLRMPMTIIVQLMNLAVEFSVSNKRTKEFLVAEELESDMLEEKNRDDDAEAIQMLDVTASWDSDDRQPTLKNIDLFVPKAALYAVVGKVGSGKSSLLEAILGEMGTTRGKIQVNGSKAYVSQISWIQNMTVRDNILFGKEYDKNFYDQVVHACALRPDLKILPQGDLTEIGEKGVNLSGGQKARIALARAVYQDSDIYLLDDPLSAVDAHVGRHIYDKVIGSKGILKAKTRILVTHGLTHVKEADEILVMNNGRIVESGTYSNLLVKKGLFNKFVEEYESRNKSETESYDEDENDHVSEDLIQLEKIVRRSLSSQISMQEAKVSENDKLIKKEEVFKGNVKPRLYGVYARAASVGPCLLFVAGIALHELLQVARNYWLSAWSEEHSNTSNTSTSTINENTSLSYNLGVYASIGIVEALVLTASSIQRVRIGMSASQNLHHPLIRTLMRLPMSFFDSTPQGRILNRCSKDMQEIDGLPQMLQYFFLSTTQLLATLLVIAYSTPMIQVAFFPIMLGYYMILKFYVPIMRQFNRLFSLNTSPINSHLGQSIQGASTIRAFDKIGDFRMQNGCLHDQFARCSRQRVISNRWLAIRLEFIGTLVIFLAALFGVISKGLAWPISAGVIGMSISYALNLTDTMNFIIREVSDIQNGMVAVERVVEYTEIPKEDSENRKLQKPPKSWPTTGNVKFRGYSARYHEKLDLVLNNVSADIKHGEKIGIVGRTGAGKSSFTLALFRMIEAAEGRILIDGVDIASIELRDLRGALTIIPQDPVLFSGSLRFNLDPFDKSSDEEINEAVILAHLTTVVESVGSLDNLITEGGENISVGQRQLVCLGRAILRRSRILILDEATAAVDVTTDALIQETIREHFKDSTVLTIAHRLNTVLDYDRILVLDHGRVIEFDSPANLIADKSSEFSKMLEQSKTKRES